MLLKKELDLFTLDIYDLQLVEYGKKIIKIRESFIKTLNEIAGKIHLDITNGKEKLEIQYLHKCRYRKL